MRTALAAAAVSLAAPAAAQDLVDAGRPGAILDLARAFGAADLVSDPVGDPMISGSIDGWAYRIYFFGCTDNADCATLLFQAACEAEAASAEAVNAFNRTALFGRAFIDDRGDYVVGMPVNLAFGVSRDTLEDTFADWANVLTEFADFAARN